MSIEQIVDVQIQTATLTPTRQGFGVPLIVGYSSNALLPIVKTYASLTELVVDHAATTHIYKMATVLMSQSPRVSSFKVGLLARSASPTVPDATFTLTYTEATPTAGRVVSVTINDEVASYTVQPADTVTLVHTGIAAAINGLPGAALHTAVGAAGQVTVTAASAGPYVSCADMNEFLSYKDTTLIGTLVADLAAILAADSNWYMLLSDSRSEARINADAVWANENDKLYIAQTHDTDVTNIGTTTDIASDLVGLTNKRTAVLWTRNNNNFIAAGAAGYALPLDPGTYTWVFKNIAGVITDTITGAIRSSFVAKRVMWYETVAGLNITQGGKVAGGGFIDNLQTTDWLISEIEAEVFTLLANSPKVPFTDAGIRQVSDTVGAVLQRAENLGLLAPEPKFSVTSPKALDIATVDRTARTLNKIEFTGRLAGAIHKVIVRGTLTV